MEVLDPRSTCNAFHRVGTQTLNALNPYVFSRYVVYLSKNLSADLKFLAGIYIKQLDHSNTLVPLIALTVQ